MTLSKKVSLKFSKINGFKVKREMSISKFQRKRSRGAASCMKTLRHPKFNDKQLRFQILFVLNTSKCSSPLNLHIKKTHAGLSTIEILSGLRRKQVINITFIMPISNRRGFNFKKARGTKNHSPPFWIWFQISVRKMVPIENVSLPYEEKQGRNMEGYLPWWNLDLVRKEDELLPTAPSAVLVIQRWEKSGCEFVWEWEIRVWGLYTVYWE